LARMPTLSFFVSAGTVFGRKNRGKTI